MTTFLLIRHGMTDAVGATLTGRAPGLPLNAVGRDQIARLAESLKLIRLNAIVAGPLERAQDTARAIAALHEIDVETMEAFDEVEFGAWTGRTIRDLDGDEEWKLFNSIRSLTRPEGGEGMLEVQQRALEGMLLLRDRYPEGTVAIVSHGDVIRGILLLLLGMPIDHINRLEVSPARVSVVTMSRDAVRVLQVNGESATLPHEPGA